jgi:protein-tyrosine phosphatase
MSDIGNKVSVLFVCMGNICRSPAGEGVFRNFVEKAGYGQRIIADSAGTISYHTGEPPDFRMLQAAARRGYQLDSIARQVTLDDLENFDLIVAMDQDNLYDLQRMTRGYETKVRLLGSFLPGESINGNPPAVPDPYYGGTNGFETVLDMIESACPAMLIYCEELLADK